MGYIINDLWATLRYSGPSFWATWHSGQGLPDLFGTRRVNRQSRPNGTSRLLQRSFFQRLLTEQARCKACQGLAADSLSFAVRKNNRLSKFTDCGSEHVTPRNSFCSIMKTILCYRSGTQEFNLSYHSMYGFWIMVI